jgi:hypothetical protein
MTLRTGTFRATEGITPLPSAEWCSRGSEEERCSVAITMGGLMCRKKNGKRSMRMSSSRPVLRFCLPQSSPSSLSCSHPRGGSSGAPRRSLRSSPRVRPSYVRCGRKDQLLPGVWMCRRGGGGRIGFQSRPRRSGGTLLRGSDGYVAAHVLSRGSSTPTTTLVPADLWRSLRGGTDASAARDAHWVAPQRLGRAHLPIARRNR